MTATGRSDAQGITLLAELYLAHDAGILNENELEAVVRELHQGQPLTLDRLVRVFGTAIYTVLLEARALEHLATAITARVRKELDV